MDLKSRFRSIVLAGRIHIGFLGTAIVLVLISIVFNYQNNKFLSEISFQLGIAVVGVTMIEFIWRILGGDPLSKLIDRLLLIIPFLESQKKLGIKQLYANRDDAKVNLWIEYMKSAKQVDMMANTLRENWTSNDLFLRILEENARKKRCRFRILTLDPGSNACIERAREEEDKVGRLSITIQDSLLKFWDVMERLKQSKTNEYLQVRTKKEGNLYCSIIRADDKMLISFYLSSVRGSNAPTLEIYGKQNILFERFTSEFEKMWKTSLPWSLTT